MRVAIISDVHNNTVNLKKVLDYCDKNEIKEMVCCGDLASEETLNFLCDNFVGKIYYTFGNMDNGQLRDLKFVPEYKNAKLFKDYGEAIIDGKKIAFTHYPELARKLCLSRGSGATLRDETGKLDFVFYGHTHDPWEENINECRMLNPGTVGGERNFPTFAVWKTENDNFELIRLNDLE